MKTYAPRKLPDLLLNAFHRACDDGNLAVARSILTIVNSQIDKQEGRTKHRLATSLIASHDRLWHLQQVAA